MGPAKYCKKPVVVEALEYVEGHMDVFKFCPTAYIDEYTKELIIPTLEGDFTVKPGDYIIRGVKGEFYPCKPDIFKMTYETADSQSREEN